MEGYTDALRRICAIAYRRSQHQAEDEAAREAVDAIMSQFHTGKRWEAWWNSLEDSGSERRPAPA